MTDIYIDNRYTRIYYAIVERARLRVLQPALCEEHHIIPKSFYKSERDDGWLPGDANVADNLVMLSLREHIVCHRLLTRMTTDLARDKMDIAYWLMINGPSGRVNSRTYELIRIRVMEAVSRWSKRMWDDPLQREKIVAAQNAGKNTPEYKAAISAWSTEYYADPAHRAAQSLRVNALWQDPEYRTRAISALNAAWQDPSLRVLKSEQTKLRWKDQEFRDFMASARESYWADQTNVQACSARSKATWNSIWADSERTSKALQHLSRAREASRERNSDKTVYDWYHEDGRTERATRREFATKHGFTRSQVAVCFSRTGRNRTCRGWRAITPD